MTSIAVIGTSGALGKFVLEEFQDSKYEGKVNYPVKAVSTKDKSAESNDKIQYIQANVTESADDLAAQLAGTDVIISLTTASEQVFENVEKVVKAVKPKIYIPSEFGTENDVADPSLIHPGNKIKLVHGNKVAADLKDTTKVVYIYSSLFRIPPVFLYAFTNHIGVDQQNKTVTYIDNDKQSFNFATGTDLARVVGTVATTDASKVLPKYRVYSGIKKIKDVVAELEKESGAEYTVKYITREQAKNDYLKTVEAGSPDLIAYLFYELYGPPGTGLQYTADEKEVVNPGESLWKWDSW